MFPVNSAEAEPPLAVACLVVGERRERVDSKKNEFWLAVGFCCLVGRLL